jgi:hypothetical protein
MSYVDLTAVRILADSYWHDPSSGIEKRITTFELTFPRCVLAEFNTHCQLARNSASSRAIPVEKIIARVLETPFVPDRFSKNQKGMQASEYWVPGDPEYPSCTEQWLNARDAAVKHAKVLTGLGVHKQDVNRLLEPWMWQTVIATATWEYWDWPNFIRLRASDQADPKISKVAYMLRDVAKAHEPKRLDVDQWHLPLTGFPGDEELTPNELIKVSTARCARVSYLTHEGIRDVQADLDLFKGLQGNGHYSPFEHAAHPHSGRTAKYTGWRSARYYIERGEEPAA